MPPPLATMEAPVRLKTPSASPSSAVRDSPHSSSLRLSALLSLFARIQALGIATQFITPQIVVVGDQSSGKSSTISAISSAPLEIGQGTTTRTPHEVLFVKNDTPGWRAFIKPCPDLPLSDAARKAIDVFNSTKWEEQGDTTLAFTAAKRVLGVETRGFSRHLVSFHIHGPNVQPFCYVDTPGLVRSVSNPQQAEEKAAVVQILRDCLKRESLIVLATVSCQQEWNNHEVLDEIFKAGKMQDALLVVSKPDKIDADETVKQAQYFGAVKHQTNGDFGHGAHVVRNLGPGEHLQSLAGGAVDRDAEEARVFRGKMFEGINPAYMGVPALVVRLESMLVALSEKRLPAIHRAITRELEDARTQHRELARAAKSYDVDTVQAALAKSADLFRDALTGTSDNPLLILRGAGADSSPLLLASHLQERLSAFVEEVADNGHRWLVTKRAPEHGASVSLRARPSAVESDVETIGTQALIEFARDFVTRTNKIPTNFDAALATCLFSYQAAKWPNIVERLLSDVVEMARECLVSAAQCVTKDPDLGRILIKLVGEDVTQLLEGSLARISTPGLHVLRTGQLVMDFDPKIWEAVFVGRVDRLESIVEQETGAGRKPLSVRQYFDVLRGGNLRATLQTVTCAEAIEGMQAQYKVERDLLVGGFSLTVVKKQIAACVVAHLDQLRPSAKDLEAALGHEGGPDPLSDELQSLDAKIDALEKLKADLEALAAGCPAESRKRLYEDDGHPAPSKSSKTAEQ